MSASPQPPVEDDLPEQVRVRREKYDRLRAAGTAPYSLGAPRTSALTALREEYADLETDTATGYVVSITGRVVLSRTGGKLCFATLQEGAAQLQVMISLDGVGEQRLADWKADVDLGDHVGITGEVISSRRGELSVLASEWLLTSKALRPLPDKHKGLSDPELRIRQRYLDLVVNPASRQLAHDRATIVRAVRDVLHGADFVEVETPVLQMVHGGAAARPFHTHLNALDLDMTLRIALELYLKRLVVGGMDRVFEIGRIFRNEGVDSTHSPEFTMLEFYEAYGDYETMMETVEALVDHAANAVHGSSRFTFQGHEIDVTPPWPRKTLRDAIREGSGIDYAAYPDGPVLLAAARDAGGDVEDGTVWPRIVDELLKQFVRPHQIQPIFLTDYPVELSPLAKRKPDDPSHVERFQPYIGGGEIGNSFTELNDPLDQLARFQDQQRDADAGDDEAMPIDLDFVTALMYGMPPTGGVGIGIDRLVMLLADQPTLRDVILFPAMRKLPPGGDDTREQDGEEGNETLSAGSRNTLNALS